MFKEIKKTDIISKEQETIKMIKQNLENYQIKFLKS